MADPIYRKIAEDLRREIETGALAPGSQLFTELELREHYGASRNTVRDAIKWLITRGLVETRPGQGTFVVEQIIPYVTTLTPMPVGAGGDEGSPYILDGGARRTPRLSPVRVEIQSADPRLAGELHLADDLTVISRHQRRYLDDVPWSVQTSFYPMRLIEHGATQLIQAGNIEEGAVEYLKRAIGVEQVGWRDALAVRAPDAIETAFFRLPDDGRVPVLEIRRTAFDKQGAPIRLTVSAYPADRNEFVINVGDVPDDVADPTAADAD